MHKYYILFFIFNIFITTVLVAQTPSNPLRPKNNSTSEQTTVENEPSMFQSIVKRISRPSQWLLSFSRDMERRISGSITSMIEEKVWWHGLLAFVFAVAFGIVHVLGPGHGKIFTALYFTSRKSHIKEGLLFSMFINIVDSLSAIAVVGIGYGIIRAVFSDFSESAGKTIALFSYGSIVLFGVLHLFSHLFSSHSHNHSTEKIRPWMLALVVGLIPCPVSTFLFVYGIVHNVIGFALLLILGTSIGGFISMSILSLFIISGKHTLDSLTSHKSGRSIAIIEFMTSALIIGFGLLFFLAAL